MLLDIETSHAETLDSLRRSCGPPSPLVVIVGLVLSHIETTAPGAVDDMIARLTAQLALRQRPVPAAVLESQRAALAWLSMAAPRRAKMKKGKRIRRPSREDRR